MVLNRAYKIHIILPISLILIGGAFRLLPHPANFTPIGAMALFGGAVLGRKYALVVPLAALFAGDLFLGFYGWKIMSAVYGSFVLVGVLGLFTRRYAEMIHESPLRGGSRVLGASLLGSILFYLITNWAVWAFGIMYPKTVIGLVQSYAMALPFFRNTIMGDLFFSGVFFGVWAGVMYYKRNVKIPNKFQIKA